MKKFISALTALVLSAGIILTPCAPSIGAEAYNITAAAKSSQSSGRANPPAAVKSITNETFINYTSVKRKYKPSSNKMVCLFNFNTSLSAGFGEKNIAIPTEADYGITGSISGRTLSAAVYDHTKAKSVKAVYLEGLDESSSLFKKLSLTNGKLRLDTKSFPNGLYRILVDFSNNKAAKLNFYVNGNETLLCQLELIDAETAKLYEKRRTALANVLKKGNITPKNSLSLENVWYPFYEFEDGTYNSAWRCDTQRWIDLSNKIVKDSWSDEYKLFKITAWVRENIAYDDFVKSSTKSRAHYYSDYSGKYSTYDLRAGVCFDYANIISIMCRAQGIPAITIGSTQKNHVWNAVYINSRWMEVDACSFEKYHVQKDVSVKTKSTDEPYGGIYKILPQNSMKEMPSDALANQYFQQNSYNVY